MTEAEEKKPAPPGFWQHLASYWTIELNVAILFLLLYLNFTDWNRSFGRGCLVVSGAVFLYWVGLTIWRLVAPGGYHESCPRCGRKMAYVDNMAGRCPYCATSLAAAGRDRSGEA